MQYNTRIAPSPTGDMHLGTARTAYFNWLAAKATGGKFVLRIDDTDTARNQAKTIPVIWDTIYWLGLKPDRIIQQSKRADVYETIKNQMLKFGTLKKEDNGTFVMVEPRIPDTWTDDVVGQVKVSDFEKDIIRRTVLFRSDGTPTYHLASVVDDADLSINYVIRGVDHISNTARHITIYHAIGYEGPAPTYAHVGLVFKDKKKMSKRDNAASMLKYKENGYSPAALLNFMARLGWGPSKDDKSTTLLSQERMVELFFKGGKMRAAPSGFDQNKLDFYNRKYNRKSK